MTEKPLKIAIIAGEVSGDLLGADLIAWLRQIYPGPIELVGVGGEGLHSQGLQSLFDFSELSIMGFTQVLARLPLIIRRLRQTASAIIAARPDLLIIVDSPDFTHRVAKRVRMALPDLPVVNYVCPSVWAWKEYRAQRMLGYVDLVLAVLPFEPAAMERLGGPRTVYVGHRLTADPALLNARQLRQPPLADRPPTIMLLPGSRGSEITKLLPVFRAAVDEFVTWHPGAHFVLPTIAHREALVRSLVKDWPVQPEVVVGHEAKWRAFARADAAMAASGTVILELALTGVPTVSTYKMDWLARLVASRIKIWSGALPNIIADYPVVPEYLNEIARGGSLARWVDRLSRDTLQRRAVIEGYDLVWDRMTVEKPPGQSAAETVLSLLDEKKAGHD